MAKSIKKRVTNAIKALLPGPVRDAQLRASYCRALGLIHFAPWHKYRIFDSQFGKNCRLGGKCIIKQSSFGDYSYAETDVRITQTDIGNYCSIGPGAQIGLAGHPLKKYASTHPAFYLNRPELGYDLVSDDSRSDYTRTTIGSDVWIGTNAIIKDGITIGDGAIVGAGAVVTKDVEPYTIVAGVPAKPIRKRFDGDTIQALLGLKWWDRGEAWIREHITEMTDIDQLVALWKSETSSPPPQSSEQPVKENHGVS